MKRVLLLTLIILLPSLLFSQTKIFIGNTHENGAIIPTQTSEQALQTKKFITEFFKWLQTAAKDPKAITKKDLLTYFNNLVIYNINDKTLAYDVPHLLARFHKMPDVYKSMQVILPVKTIIIANNNIAVHYQLKIINQKNQPYIDDIVVLISLKKDKIIEWRAVIAHHSV